MSRRSTGAGGARRSAAIAFGRVEPGGIGTAPVGGGGAAGRGDPAARLGVEGVAAARGPGSCQAVGGRAGSTVAVLDVPGMAAGRAGAGPGGEAAVGGVPGVVGGLGVVGAVVDGTGDVAAIDPVPAVAFGAVGAAWPGVAAGPAVVAGWPGVEVRVAGAAVVAAGASRVGLGSVAPTMRLRAGSGALGLAPTVRAVGGAGSGGSVSPVWPTRRVLAPAMQPALGTRQRPAVAIATAQATRERHLHIALSLAGAMLPRAANADRSAAARSRTGRRVRRISAARWREGRRRSAGARGASRWPRSAAGGTPPGARGPGPA